MNVLQNFWVKDHRQIYLVGNPMIWWLSTAAVAGYIAVRGILILRAQRGYRDFENSKRPFPPLRLLNVQTTLCSQSRQVRHAMWLPLHGMEPPLPPILPHGSPVIPSSLSSRTVFRDPTTLCRLRLFDVDIPSALASPDRGGAHNYRNLEFLDLQPADIWEHMDQRGMSKSSMVENLGLQLVRNWQCVCCRHTDFIISAKLSSMMYASASFFLADR